MSFGDNFLMGAGCLQEYMQMQIYYEYWIKFWHNIMEASDFVATNVRCGLATQDKSQI